MTLDRRSFNRLGAAAALGALAGPALAETMVLKISHQFPGGSIDAGDFRDRLCQKFGLEVEKRTKGALRFQV
jgi:TRAP-type C4-dicarboxylate transport system substrate-binding protein